ncbi:MAG: alpha/beta fold hydrolase [Hyphomonadaceae bacterium]
MARLDYRLEGEKGPAIVLLHAVGLNLDHSAGIAAHLGRGRRILRVSARGHGGSEDIANAISLSDFAADIASLIKELRVGPAWVAGLSFGGMLAQHLAVDHGGLVAGLVLTGTSHSVPAEARLALVQRGRAAEERGMAGILEETLDRWFAPNFRHAPVAAAARETLLGAKPRNWALTWAAMAEMNLAHRMSEITKPTLALVGDHDVSSTPTMVRALADSIKGAAYAEIAGAGHMAPIEEPARFAALVSDFIDARL